jgi:hypothetical protein
VPTETDFPVGSTDALAAALVLSLQTSVFVISGMGRLQRPPTCLCCFRHGTAPPRPPPSSLILSILFVVVYQEALTE